MPVITEGWTRVATVPDAHRWQAFTRFCRLQLASGDYDPMYPVLRERCRGWDRERALRYVFLYLALYDLASAEEAAAEWADVPLHAWTNPTTWWHYPWNQLRTGTERRNLRGGRVREHLEALAAATAPYEYSLAAWLTDGFGDDPRQNWARLQHRLQTVWGNGRWAAYKGGEVLMTVVAAPVCPTDMGHEFSTGPRWGMALLLEGLPDGNTPQSIRTLNQMGLGLQALLEADGVRLRIEQLETMLCNFGSMVRGRYYPGHDIDEQQEMILRMPAEHQSRFWAIREQVFPHTYLGERGGWVGIDPARCRWYRDQGVVEGRS